MDLRPRARALGIWLCLAFFIGAPGVQSAIPIAHGEEATGAHLILSEVNWAGSAGASDDEWVELFNPSAAPIQFAATPYTLSLADGTILAVLDASVPDVPAFGHVLVSQKTPGTTGSTLAPSVQAVVRSTLSIPNADTQVQLKNGMGVVIDHAGSGIGPMPAGTMTASMSRVVSMTGMYTDGSDAASWYTTTTVGTGLLPASTQFGTPAGFNVIGMSVADTNPMIPVPTGVMLVPSSPTDNRPDVRATFTTPATYGSVRFINVATMQVYQGVGDPVAGYEPSIPLPAGSYSIEVAGLDAPSGNRSEYVVVPVPESTDGTYTVVGDVLPVTEVAPAMVTPLTATTDQMTYTVHGTAVAGTSLLTTVNGAYTGAYTVPADGMFMIPVSLTPNAQTIIELRVKDMISGKESVPTTVRITHDVSAPAVLNVGNIVVMSNRLGAEDTIRGNDTSGEPGALVKVYADAALTQLIGSAVVQPNGSFAPIGLGDNKYPRVYVAQIDAVGNMSPVLTIENPISLAGEALTLTVFVSNVGTDRLTVKVLPVNGATNYYLRLMGPDGSWSPTMSLCDAGECMLERTITSLNPDTRYVVAVAAVDAQGGTTTYTQVNVHTVALPATVAPTPAPVVATVTPVPYVAQTTTRVMPRPPVAATPTPTAAPTPEVSPSPSPEEGDVQSASATARNWTPWIILAVLVALAALAVAGYFYWFGADDLNGTNGGGSNGSSPSAPTTPTEPSSTVSSSSTAPPPRKDKNKRW